MKSNYFVPKLVFKFQLYFVPSLLKIFYLDFKIAGILKFSLVFLFLTFSIVYTYLLF